MTDAEDKTDGCVYVKKEKSYGCGRLYRDSSANKSHVPSCHKIKIKTSKHLKRFDL